MAEEEVKQESTQIDYWNTVNAGAIQFNYPEARFRAQDDIKGALDTEAPDFREVFDVSDGETKRAMLDAMNNSHALKIAERRKIFNESAERISQDGIMTQLGMGLLPALASPTTLLPAGALFKGAQLAKTATKLGRVRNTILAGGTVGAGVNIADEALFDAQGMPTNYLGAGAMGGIFGGLLGGLGGMMSGPYASKVAKGVSRENDTFTKDFTTDPNVLVDIDVDGVPKLQDIGKMDKSLIDKVPFIGSWLRSDVHTVYQSENPLLRSWMGRISAATTSLTDSVGNLLPINRTGMDFKRQTKGIQNSLIQDVTTSFNLAKEAGFKGSRDDFNVQTYKMYIDELNNQKNKVHAFTNTFNKNRHDDIKARRRKEKAELKTEGLKPKEITAVKEEIDTRYSQEMKEADREVINNWYNDNPTQFKGDANIVKGAESYRKYFQGMLKRSQEVGIKELKGFSPNRLYAPRIYNYKDIRSGKVSPEAIETQVKQALMNDARNSGLSKKELDNATAGIQKMLMETSFDMNNLSSSYLVKDLPFSTHLKQKKLYLNESYMPDLLVTNFDDVAGRYHYKMAGRQATQYAFGTDQLSDVMKMIREDSLERGVVNLGKDVEAFERSVRDLLGDLRMNGLSDTPGWTFTRNLNTYNSARMGGGFGGNQFIELASSLMMNGMEALFSGRLKTSLKNSADVLFKEGKQHDEFSKYLINSGYMSDALHSSRINRYSDTEAGFNSGSLEKSLNWMNDKLMKYNGMRYFMGVMEDFTGSAIVTQLKSGKVDAKRLARWGLDDKTAKSLGSKLKEVTTGDSWDLSKLSTKQQDQLQLAISRGIEEVVVQGDSIHLPSWMKTPNAFRQVLFQFMRFPLIAQETLTRRGMKEDQARMIGGLLASSVTYMGLKYMREQAAIAAGTIHPIDSKYDYYNNPDTLEKALMESLNYNAPLGFMSSVYNYGAIATGQPELGRDWQGKNGMSSLMGPSGGFGEDIIQLIRAGVNGELDTERNLQRFKSLTPFMNLPLVNEGGKYLAEEFGN